MILVPFLVILALCLLRASFTRQSESSEFVSKTWIRQQTRTSGLRGWSREGASVSGHRV